MGKGEIKMRKIRIIFEKTYRKKHIYYMTMMLIYMEKVGVIIERNSYETDLEGVCEYDVFPSAYKFLKYMEEYDMFRIEEGEIF